MEIYIKDSFHVKAYKWLKEANSEGGNNSVSIHRKDKRRIMDNKWKVTASNGKYSTNKTDMWSQRLKIFQVLGNSHSAIAHRGRDKTKVYMRKLSRKMPIVLAKFTCTAIDHRSVKLAVKRNSSGCHWSKITLAFLRREFTHLLYSLTYQSRAKGAFHCKNWPVGLIRP